MYIHPPQRSRSLNARLNGTVSPAPITFRMCLLPPLLEVSLSTRMMGVLQSNALFVTSTFEVKKQPHAVRSIALLTECNNAKLMRAFRGVELFNNWLPHMSSFC